MPHWINYITISPSSNSPQASRQAARNLDIWIFSSRLLTLSSAFPKLLESVEVHKERAGWFHELQNCFLTGRKQVTMLPISCHNIEKYSDKVHSFWLVSRVTKQWFSHCSLTKGLGSFCVLMNGSLSWEGRRNTYQRFSWNTFAPQNLFSKLPFRYSLINLLFDICLWHTMIFDFYLFLFLIIIFHIWKLAWNGISWAEFCSRQSRDTKNSTAVKH